MNVFFGYHVNMSITKNDQKCQVFNSIHTIQSLYCVCSSLSFKVVSDVPDCLFKGNLT